MEAPPRKQNRSDPLPVPVTWKLLSKKQQAISAFLRLVNRPVSWLYEGAHAILEMLFSKWFLVAKGINRYAFPSGTSFTNFSQEIITSLEELAVSQGVKSMVILCPRWLTPILN